MKTTLDFAKIEPMAWQKLADFLTENGYIAEVTDGLGVVVTIKDEEGETIKYFARFDDCE